MTKIANTYNINDFSTYRPGDPEDHGSGLAVDYMTYQDSQKGWSIANDITSSMADNNVSYIIYEQQFYSNLNNIYGPANTWNPMPDRGSITQNHYDHVHVSYNTQ